MLQGKGNLTAQNTRKPFGGRVSAPANPLVGGEGLVVPSPGTHPPLSALRASPLLPHSKISSDAVDPGQGIKLPEAESFLVLVSTGVGKLVPFFVCRGKHSHLCYSNLRYSWSATAANIRHPREQLAGSASMPGTSSDKSGMDTCLGGSVG